MAVFCTKILPSKQLSSYFQFWRTFLTILQHSSRLSVGNLKSRNSRDAKPWSYFGNHCHKYCYGITHLKYVFRLKYQPSFRSSVVCIWRECKGDCIAKIGDAVSVLFISIVVPEIVHAIRFLAILTSARCNMIGRKEIRNDEEKTMNFGFFLFLSQ